MQIDFPDEHLTEVLRKALGSAVSSPPGQPASSGFSCETAQALHEIKAEIRSNNSPWLTRRGAADYAHCSVGHIDYLAQAGRIKRYPGPRYMKADMDKCIQSGRFVQTNGKVQA